MSNVAFTVPRLVKEGAWLDYRGKYNNGFAGFGDRALSEIRFAAPHHSVTNPTGNAERDCNTLFNIHAGNGWNMIGYNFVVTSEEVNGFAKVAYVGDLGSVRAHTPNTKGAKGMAAGLGNRYIVAACMIGQNHITPPTVAQLRSMKLLMQELLFFENDRLPNLWPQWDDMWPHYTWDWTQCNGFESIRQQIIDVAIPSDAPTPPPAPANRPVPAAKKLDKVKKFTARFDKTEVWDLTSNPNYKSTKTLTKGEPFDAYAVIEFNDTLYYVTEYSFGKGWKNGVNQGDLVEVPVIVTPPPAPAPEPEKPVVRALGALMTVKVNNGDKVIDVVTKAVTKTYAKDEPFEATHTVEFEGIKYYMTQYSYDQYAKGKNPTGIDIRTVDAWVIVPTEPDPTPLPPADEKPETPPELIEQHDKDIKDINSRLSLLEKIVKAITDFLSGLFKNFKV